MKRNAMLLKKYVRIFLLVCAFNFLNGNASAQTLPKNEKGSLKKIMTVPDIVGLQLRDAKILLAEFGIEIGKVFGLADSTNSGNYFIYKQYPSRYKKEDSPNYIHKNQRIDVWIQKQKPVIPIRRFKGANANDYLDTISVINVKE